MTSARLCAAKHCPTCFSELEHLEAVLNGVGDQRTKLRATLETLFGCVPALGHHAIPIYDCPERDLAKAMNEAAKELGKPVPYPVVEDDANGEQECDCVVPIMEGAGQHSPACSIFKKPNDELLKKAKAALLDPSSPGWDEGTKRLLKGMEKPKYDDRQHLLERCYHELYASMHDEREHKREDCLKAARAIAERIAAIDNGAEGSSK